MKPDSISEILGPQGISVVFQPIFDLSDDKVAVHSYEALCRGPRGTHFERAGVLFDYVRLKREEIRVDRHCLSRAIEEGASLARLAPLAINIHASTISCDADLPRYISEVTSRHDVDPTRLVLELVEQSSCTGNRKLALALDSLREMGIRIALDDVGRGHCNYEAMLDVRPDILKIDRYFVQNCAADWRRLAMLRSIASLADSLGASVVAEGIEQEEELAAVRTCGIRLGQGYLLGRPMKHEPVSVLEPISELHAAV